MIKLTLNELYAARGVLDELVKIDFSISTGYLISRMAKAANVELILAETKRRDLIRKYGEQDKVDGDTWRVKPENQEEVDKQLKALFEVEVDLACDPIKISLLDGERAISHNRLLVILTEVREGKLAPLDAIPEIRGLSFRLKPIETARIEKFLIQD
jgi:hypothetical protein